MSMRVSLSGLVLLILFTLDTASGIDLLDAIVEYISSRP